jgi:hypothetical protein
LKKKIEIIIIIIILNKNTRKIVIVIVIVIMNTFKRSNQELEEKDNICESIVKPFKKLRFDDENEEIYYSDINTIPIEILSKIFNYVDDETLLTSVCNVNNYWRSVCKTHITITKLYNNLYYNINQKLLNIQYFNKIKEIEFTISDINDKAFYYLDKLPQKCFNVEKISFIKSNVFSKFTFYVIANKFPNLKNLYIEECSQIDDEFFSMFNYGFKNLEELSININYNITNKSLEYISNNCFKLKHIDLYKLDNIKNNDIDYFIKNLHNIVHFNLSNCQYLNGTIFNTLHKHTNKLKKAYLVNTEIKCDEITTLIKNSKYIDYFKISYFRSNINYALNLMAQNLKELKTLDISFNESFINFNINYISNYYFPKLETLKLTNNIKINDSGYETLFSKIPNIKHIDIALLFQTTKNNITCKTIQSLVKYCKNIESIAIDNRTNLTDNELNLIATTYKNTLKHISFNNCIKFSGEGVINLVTLCPKIESLIMNGCINLKNNDILTIGKINPNIKKLDIGSNNKLNNNLLRDICLFFPKLNNFNMANNEYINEWGLSQFMNKANNLKEINLLKCNKINYKNIEKYTKKFKHNDLKITQLNETIHIVHQITESLYIGD